MENNCKVLRIVERQVFKVVFSGLNCEVGWSRVVLILGSDYCSSIVVVAQTEVGIQVLSDWEKLALDSKAL